LVNSFFEILLFIGASAVLIYFAFIKNKSTSTSSSSNSTTSDKKQSFDYYHDYAGTAIGVAKLSSELYLKNGKIEKTYSFADVRNWESSIQSNEVYRGNGMAGIAASMSVAANNKKNTGLFIDVRDIENPKWIVRFKLDRNIEKNMGRWMEILRQTINES